MFYNAVSVQKPLFVAKHLLKIVAKLVLNFFKSRADRNICQTHRNTREIEKPR